MPDLKCEKCGEVLAEAALSCWACGTLTPAGRRARGAEDDETWRRAAEEAKQRQAQAPAVDPDEALRRVLAQTGTEEPAPRAATKPSVAGNDRHSEATRLRDSADTLGTVGLLLAALFAFAGVVLVVAVLMSLEGSVATLLTVAGLMLFGALSVTVHWLFQNLAATMRGVAEAADSARRTAALLRDQTNSRTDR